MRLWKGKTMKRKILGVALAGVLMTSLVACGKQAENVIPEEYTAVSEMDVITDVQDDYEETTDETIEAENADAIVDNAAINFFVDRDVSNKDRLVSLYFSEPDENGNPTVLYAKGGNHPEITLCNYQIISGSIENCSKENSIIIYADCIYSDNETDQLTINMYPSGEGNTWEMMITSPSDLEGYYLIDGEGPAVTASGNAEVEGSSYWFVDYTFVSDDETTTFKLISGSDGVPTKVEITQGDPYNINEVCDIDGFTVSDGPLFNVSISYFRYDSEGELSLVGLDFECQDGEAIVNAPGNMAGHYMGF